MMRVAHHPNDACGRGRDHEFSVNIKLALSWSQRIPGTGKTIDVFDFDFGEVPLTLESAAPRRIAGTAENITARVVVAGASGTVRLTEYIEDPEKGPVTFKVSDPRGLRVEINDAGVMTLTAPAGTRGALET